MKPFAEAIPNPGQDKGKPVLFVNEKLHSRGIGSKFMKEIELILKKNGYDNLFLSVDPIDDLKTHKFYSKLGYQDIQIRPFRCSWELTDSDGNKHKGNEWNIDMFKLIINTK